MDERVNIGSGVLLPKILPLRADGPVVEEDPDDTAKVLTSVLDDRPMLDDNADPIGIVE